MADDTPEGLEDVETKSVNVPFPVEEHERMRRIKDWHNASWREVIERGIGTFDAPEMAEQ